MPGSSFWSASTPTSALLPAAANVAAAACSAGASSATVAGESVRSASRFSASIFCGSTFSGSIPSTTTGLAGFETAATTSAGASTTGVSGIAAVVSEERSPPCSDKAFALAANSASASLLSTAAAIAETPVIPTDSISPPGAAANVAANVLNISASSEIAASSVVNATGSATHRGPATTTVPCDVETSAF